MVLMEEGCQIRIFIKESDQKEGIPLYEWLVREAMKQGIAGATVLRGVEGFGAAHQINKAGMFEFPTDLPVIIEVVDMPEKIEKFISLAEQVITEGAITSEKVHIRLYRNKSS